MVDAVGGAGHPFGMAKDDQPPKTPAGERDRKLAEALRANLRRRKAGAAKAKVLGSAEDDPKAS